MIRRILVGSAIVAVLLIVTGLSLAWHGAMQEVEPPGADHFAQADVERGQMLAGIGNCVVCHTTDEGADFAGGRAMPTGFGTLRPPTSPRTRTMASVAGRSLRSGVPCAKGSARKASTCFRRSPMITSAWSPTTT
ncbi:MAG: hypothetical protein U5R48_01795 [Gammaproteobacteria bacterium]|nr:hypothetical protein [Gammaproteobacteria bacterium]